MASNIAQHRLAITEDEPRYLVIGLMNKKYRSAVII